MSDDWSKYRTDTCAPDPRGIVAPQLMGDGARLPTRVDLRADMPPIEDQGEVQSCAANAIGAAMDYLMKKRGNNGLKLSRLFIYFNGRAIVGMEGRDGGMPTGSALASLMAVGACEDKFWPFTQDRVLMRPDDNSYRNSLTFTDIQYAQVRPGEPARQALANGWPVVFRYFGPKAMLDAAAPTGRMAAWGNRAPAQQGFGHTMLAVGYDDDAKTILVRNSWGERYGDRGYFTMPYDTLEATTNDFEFWSIAAVGLNANAAGPAGQMRMAGASMSESISYAQNNAAADYRETLKQLGQDLRKELQDDLEDAKRSIRNRLRDL